MEGGKWQRLLHFGVMHTYPVLHAVAKSGLIRFVDASERRISALAAWRLPWRAWKPSSGGPCVRLPDRMGVLEGSAVAYSARYARGYAALLMAGPSGRAAWLGR